MNVHQGWVCLWQSEIFYTENTIQSLHFNGYVKNSQAAFKRQILKTCHTVLLLGVREPVDIVLPSARCSSPSLNKFYSWISGQLKWDR